MYKKAFTVAKLNLIQIKGAYFVTGIALLLQGASYITTLFTPGSEGNIIVSAGNAFMLLPALAAIFIPVRHLQKTLNLGAKRRDVFNGAVLAYAVLSAAAALAMLVFHYAIDRFVAARIGGVLDVMVVFGFMARGPVVAFLQMFALLMLLASVAHTLTAAQDAWYGWVADVAIVAVISVFTPIAPLRAALVWFFNLIIFCKSAMLQMAACLILGAAVYTLNWPILSKKAI